MIALVLLVLAGCELFVRRGERALSRDVQHIRSIPETARELTAGEGLRVLFLGNSMLRSGVEEPLLEEELRAQGVGPLRVGRVFPDATGLVDWYYAFKHYFVAPRRLPDVLVVCFAARDLEDGRRGQPWRLARYYTAPEDFPEVFAKELPEFDTRAEFSLAYVSAAYANRTRAQTRLLDRIIPHYRETAQQINRAQQQQAPGGHAAAAPPTYERLDRFINLAKGHGVRVIFLAMPLRDEYALDPELRKTIEAAGMTLVDGRHVKGIGAETFEDEMHLNGDGAEIYTRFLARRLAPQLGGSPEAAAGVAGK